MGSHSSRGAEHISLIDPTRPAVLPVRSAGAVARYYDANTRRFLAAGPGNGTYSIHRELWGPGVESAAQAVEHIDTLLARRIEELAWDPHSVLDIGCGVGGSVFRLARAFPRAAITGVTVSRAQVRTARRVASSLGFEDRCRFLDGDVLEHDVGSGYDAAVAVESFAHVADAFAFFGAAARSLRSGGVLLVVDDFLSRPLQSLDPAGRRVVGDFRAGWLVPGVRTVAETVSSARTHGLGLLSDEDLTPLIRLGRARDRMIRVLAPVFRAAGLASIPFFGNMIGGDALQRGLRDGLLSYRMLTFQR